jgi:hypothetical protein
VKVWFSQDFISEFLGMKFKNFRSNHSAIRIAWQFPIDHKALKAISDCLSLCLCVVERVGHLLRDQFANTPSAPIERATPKAFFDALFQANASNLRISASALNRGQKNKPRLACSGGSGTGPGGGWPGKGDGEDAAVLAAPVA